MIRRSLVAVALVASLASCTAPEPLDAPTPSTPPATAAPSTPAPQVSLPPAAVGGLAAARVVRAVDGDTLVVRFPSGGQERIRLSGVDTPESTTRTEPYGKEASAFTASRAAGRDVLLEYDVGRRDRYRRVLAYVWLRPPRDRSIAEVRSAMLNGVLLAEGYATLLTVPPNVRYVDAFVELQRAARETRKGLWR